MTSALRRAAVAASLALATATAAVVSGCSSAPSSAQQALSDPARTQLQMDVLAVSRAVAAHNTTGARLAIADLEHDLTALRDSGAVSSDRAAEIQQVVDRLLGQLQAAPTTHPATTTHTTVRPTPKPKPTPKPTRKPPPKPAPAPPHHHGHGHGDQGGG